MILPALIEQYQKITDFPSDVDPYSTTFQRNIKSPIHRWFPYKEGFSQSFVERIFSKFKVNKESRILDPFAGSGTILVEAKKKGIFSAGFELNPFIYFLAEVKLNWDIDVNTLERTLNDLIRKLNFLKLTKKGSSRFIQAKKACTITPPEIKTLHKFYDEDTISRLTLIKDNWSNIENNDIQNILKLVFSSLLVDMSNASRSPSLGYKKSKIHKEKKVWEEFVNRLKIIITDLNWVQKNYLKGAGCYKLIKSDNRTSIEFIDDNFTHLITSPPYINNIDYIRNTKLELFWCDFVKNSEEFYHLKKLFSRSFLGSVTDNALVKVSPKIMDIAIKVREAKPFNKKVPAMITAYFKDMEATFSNIYKSLTEKAKLAIVVGDSCFAGVHIPTDILICDIAESLGFIVNKIEISRFRRSTFHKTRLRESILYMEK